MPSSQSKSLNDAIHTFGNIRPFRFLSLTCLGMNRPSASVANQKVRPRPPYVTNKARYGRTMRRCGGATRTSVSTANSLMAARRQWTPSQKNNSAHHHIRTVYTHLTRKKSTMLTIGLLIYMHSSVMCGLSVQIVKLFGSSRDTEGSFGASCNFY